MVCKAGKYGHTILAAEKLTVRVKIILIPEFFSNFEELMNQNSIHGNKSSAL